MHPLEVAVVREKLCKVKCRLSVTAELSYLSTVFVFMLNCSSDVGEYYVEQKVAMLKTNDIPSSPKKRKLSFGASFVCFDLLLTIL